MTATITELRPTRGDRRTVRYEALHETAQQELEETITETEANLRIARWAHAGLTTEARNDAYEQLKDALQRLSCYEMPHRCVCHDYDERALHSLTVDADADAHYAIKRLLGEPR
jgi:hypothetical protein